MTARPARAALLSALLAISCFSSRYRSEPPIAVIDGDPLVQMKPEGHFPIATRPTFVPAAGHSDAPRRRERVLGLATTAGPRAYPIGLLDRFEVVNDRAGDRSFVVTRCALTHVAAVYDRRVGARELTFVNSAALWRDTLVLRDRETGTYWTAATGRALTGPLAGKKLEPIPAVIARAGDWERAFPSTLYLELERRTSVPLMMRVYGASPWQGVSGARTEDRRFGAKRELLAVVRGSEALAFTAEEIRRRGSAVASLGGEAVSIRWDAAVAAPRAYRVSGRGEELPVVPMYWFALDRHFERVWTMEEAGRR